MHDKALANKYSPTEDYNAVVDRKWKKNRKKNIHPQVTYTSKY